MDRVTLEMNLGRSSNKAGPFGSGVRTKQKEGDDLPYPRISNLGESH